MTISAGVPVATHNHPTACADSGYLLIKLCFLDHAVCTMRMTQAGPRAGSSQTAHKPGATYPRQYRAILSTKPFGRTWLRSREQFCVDFFFFFSPFIIYYAAHSGLINNGIRKLVKFKVRLCKIMRVDIWIAVFVILLTVQETNMNRPVCLAVLFIKRRA